MCQTFSTYSIAFSQPFLTNVILFLQLSSPGISLTFASSGKYVSICYKNTAYNIMVCFKDNNPEFKILTFLAPSKSTLFFFICVSDKNVWTRNRNLFRKKNSISKDVDTVGSTYFFFLNYTYNSNHFQNAVNETLYNKRSRKKNGGINDNMKRNSKTEKIFRFYLEIFILRWIFAFHSG